MIFFLDLEDRFEDLENAIYESKTQYDGTQYTYG